MCPENILDKKFSIEFASFMLQNLPEVKRAEWNILSADLFSKTWND